MASDTCAHCPREATEHAAAEREGVVRHKFSRDGRLEPLETQQKPGTNPQTRIAKTPSDPVLRYILIQAGVITVEDLDKAEATLAATGLLTTAKVMRDAGQ